MVKDYIKWIRSKVGQEKVILVFAGGCVFDERGRVLLQKRGDSGNWGFPGGAIELGANGDQAHSICIVYELREIGGKLKCDNLETLELKYFDIDELPVMFCKQHEEIKVDLINKYGRE